MNTKNLLKLGSLLLVLTLVLSSALFAQATIFVNNNGGVDSRTGQNNNTGDNINGPVGTLTRAVELATAGDIISVAFTGVPYAEPGSPAGVANLNKRVNIVATGGTPEISAAVTINPTGTNTVRFDSPFTIIGNVNLTSGVLGGAANVTLGSGVIITRTAGTIDVAPTFTTTVHLVYSPGANMTIGPEFPPAGTILGNLTVTTNFTLTVNKAAQMKGILTLAGTSVLALGSNTLTVTSTAATVHVVDGNITASTVGGVSFNLAAGSAGYTVAVDGAGALDLPNVTVNAASASRNVTIGAATATSLNIGTTTNSGSLTNSGIGDVTLGAVATSIKGNIVNSTSGNIVIGDAAVAVTGNVTNSGSHTASAGAATTAQNRANITFASTAANLVTVGGSVSNNTTIAATSSSTTGVVQNMGNIVFMGGATIDGSVTNLAVVTPTTSAGAGSTLQGLGNVGFAGDFARTIKGAVRNQSSQTGGTTASSSTVTNLGNISFANAATNVVVNGAIVNSSTGFTSSQAVSGRIEFTARAAGTVVVGLTSSKANVQNSSTNSGSTNGTIDFLAAATGAVTVNGSVLMDGAAGAGDILFGVGNLTADGVNITRNVSGANITIPANAATLALGAVSITGGSNSVLTIGASTGAITVTSLTISAGTFGAGTGASTATLTITGNVSATGGTLDFGTGTRDVELKGVSININGVTFASAGGANAATTLVFNHNQPQTLTAGANTVFPGFLEIDNTYVLAPTFTFPSGNFTVAAAKFTDNPVTTTTPGVNLGAARLLISGATGPFGGADFLNEEGFTATTGVVTMQGTAAQVVAGTGDYYGIEVNNTHAGGVTFGTGAAESHTITGTFYLTQGSVFTGAGDDITFNNADVPPTIVRRAGVFDAAGATVVFATPVDLVYTGIANVTTESELPGGSGELNNLSIFTAGGTQTVTLDKNIEVNGTLTVNTGQTLAMVTFNIDMLGASIVNNGTITNTTGLLTLDRAEGTTITGAGLLPDIDVGNSSSGNVISGSAGVATNGGAVGTGALTVLGGGTSGEITLGFSGAGPHVLSLTTNAAENVVTLGGNLLVGGNLVHADGTIGMAGFDLSVGTANAAATHTIGAAAIFSSTGGSLIFRSNAAGTPTLTGAVTGEIDAPVVLNLFGAGEILTLNGADFTFANNVTLTRGILDLNGNDLALTGNALNLTANSSIAATGGGLLDFNPTTGDLTVTLAGATSLPDTKVTGNTTLAGSAGDLTVISLEHEGGILNFASRNIIVTPGLFSRTDASAAYAATTGELIVEGAVTQGTGMSIPNLRFRLLGNETLGTDANLTVTSKLAIETGANTLTHTVVATPRLHVADGAMVEWVSGNLDDAPVYAGTITLIAALKSAGVNITGTIPEEIWPETPVGLVSVLRIASTSTGLADPTLNAVYLPDDRSVGALDLRVGILELSANNTAGSALTVSSEVRRRQGGSVLRQPVGGLGTNLGSIAFTNPPNVWYEPSVAGAGGNITVGIELASTVGNLTVTRSANVGNSTVTVNKALTVNGTLTVRNNFATTIAGVISLHGDVTVALDAAYSNATAPTFALVAPVGFVGTVDQTITVPSTGAAVGSVTVDKASGKVILAGGNLTIGTGTAEAVAPISAQLNLISGNIETGTNVLILSNLLNNATQGYTRTVAAGGTSHVVGFLRVPLKLGQIIAFGRNEFPVGGLTNYRPAALTFVNAALPGGIALGVSATVHYDGTRPTGIVGLPIADGVSPGTDVARYPDFNWSISTTGSLGATQFNLELTAEGYTGFDDIANVRIIRRNGAVSDITNQWTLQGAQYDNFVISGVPTVVNVNSIGGLIQGGAIFTYGLKSTMVTANPIAAVNLTDGITTFTRNLANPALFTGAQAGITYSVSVANVAIVTATITGDVLTVTKKVSGATTVTVIGTDTFDGSRINHTFAVTVVSDVEPIDLVPTEFTLSQNYPNPFNPSTTIKFGLPKEAPVTLEIYNVLGVKVRTLIAGETMSASFHTLVWDGKNDGGVTVPSGVYLYRVHADKFQASKKMTLIK